jgi:hypothetical protein
MTAADVLVESLMDWGDVLTGLIVPDLPVELSPEG